MTSLTALHASIKTLPCFSNSALISALEEGDSQLSFKVLENHKAYFVKHLNPYTANTEVKAANVAAKHMIAPNVSYYSKEWLVTEFVREGHCNKTEIGQSNLDRYCLSLMARFHQIKVDLPTLELGKLLEDLSDKACINDKQKALVQMIRDRLFDNLESPEYIVPCHGDVNYSNILVLNNDRQLLIDYECSCLAEPEYDIAMFMAINGINDNNVNVIVDIYEEAVKSDRKASKLKVTRYLYICLLINALWYLACFRTNNDQSMWTKAFKQFKCLDKYKITTSALCDQMR